MKSQLNGKAVNTPKPVMAESSFAQFVLGDIKGGSAAHEYRMTVVAAAIREALKGNSRALIEATALATGNSKKAKSYFDGFAAVGVPARIAYAGKLSDPANKAIVDQIDQETVRLGHEFELAFLARYHAPAEPKAKPKKAKAAPVADEPAAPADTHDTPTVAELDVSAIISAAASAISTGAAIKDEVELLRQAIAAYDAAQLLAQTAASAAAQPVAEPA